MNPFFLRFLASAICYVDMAPDGSCAGPRWHVDLYHTLCDVADLVEGGSEFVGFL